MHMKIGYKRFSNAQNESSPNFPVKNFRGAKCLSYHWDKVLVVHANDEINLFVEDDCAHLLFRSSGLHFECRV